MARSDVPPETPAPEFPQYPGDLHPVIEEFYKLGPEAKTIFDYDTMLDERYVDRAAPPGPHARLNDSGRRAVARAGGRPEYARLFVDWGGVVDRDALRRDIGYEIRAEIGDPARLTPGRALLPPSPEPLPPAGIEIAPLKGLGANRREAWYIPPVMPRPLETGFWLMKPITDKPSIPFTWPNKELTSNPQPWRGLFEELHEPVRRVSKKKMPKRIGDYSRGLAHEVSERIVEVFREFDPDHIKTHPVEYVFADAELLYNWLHVTRVISAIDYANSRILYHKDEGYDPGPVASGPIRLMPGVERYPYFCSVRPGWSPIFVSDAMKRRFEALRPKLNWVQFQDPSGGLTI